MAETAEVTTKKAKAEVTNIQMEDGRTVGFAGNRRMDKEYIIDESKIEVGGDGTVMLAPGAVKVRIDFRNGKSILHTPNPILLAQYVGHGGSQKLGDEAANEKDVEDAFLAIEDLHQRLEAGEWNVARESGGFSGASVVVKAIAEAMNGSMTADQVKDWLAGKFTAYSAAAEAKGEKFTRKMLYDSFRNPNSKTGKIIKRMEEEKLTKDSKLDADAELAAFAAQGGQPA